MGKNKCESQDRPNREIDRDAPHDGNRLTVNLAATIGTIDQTDAKGEKANDRNDHKAGQQAPAEDEKQRIHYLLPRDAEQSIATRSGHRRKGSPVGLRETAGDRSMNSTQDKSS